VSRALRILFAAMEAPEPVLTPDGWKRIPPDVRDLLQTAQLVVPGDRAEMVRCPVCSVAHYERVIARGGHEYIRCPREYRVRISPDDRQTWRVNVGAVASSVHRSLRLEGTIQLIGTDRLLHVGRYTAQGIRSDVYLARGLCLDDAESVALRIPSTFIPPVVLVPSDVPESMTCQGATPHFIPLSRGSRLADNTLQIDRRLLGTVELQLSRGGSCAENTFRFRGDFWEIAFGGGESKHLQDSVGLRYIARLLEEPDESLHVVALLAARTGIDSRAMKGSLGPIIDNEQMQAIRARHLEVIDEIADAEKNNNAARLDELQQERDWLSIEFVKLLDHKGQPRDTTTADRVRKSVSAAVSRSIDRIDACLPELGKHLRVAISSGLTFKYAPDREIDWFL